MSEATPASPVSGGQDPGPAPQGALGRRVGTGMILLVTAALAHRGLALVAQVILGILLSPKDFGVYAIALAAAGIAQVFKDGGLRLILLQRGIRSYDTLRGPVFWMSLTFNAATAAVLAASGPVVAEVYQDPRLVAILVLTAATIPFSTPQMMSDTRLRIDLRFGVLSGVAVVSALLRYTVTILTAWAGSGPLSLVYGMLAAAVFEAVSLYSAAPDAAWRCAPRLDLWRELLGQATWTMLQTLAVSLIYFGMYASIGLFVPADEVGIYSFAFGILNQTGHLVAGQFDAVLPPSMARLQDDHARRRAAILRTMRAMVVLCVPMCLLIGMLYSPIEALIWRGRWAASTTSVWIMAATYPLFTLYVVPKAVLIGAGEFRRVAGLMLTIGAGMTACAGLSAWLGGTAPWIAAGTGAYSVAASIWMMVRGLRQDRIGAGAILASIAPVTVVLTAAAAGVVWADQSLLTGVHALARCVIVGAAGGLIQVALLRVFFPDAVHDLVRVMPARFAAPAKGLLLLPVDSPGHEL